MPSAPFCIEVPARIHISLLSMGANLPRRNGGVGFAVAAPCLRMEFTHCSDFNVASSEDGTSSELREKLATAANRWFRQMDITPHGRVEILQCLPEHSGFGIHTAAVLAMLEGLAILSGKTCSQDDLTKLSRRGGTSGIGIHTYHSGGFVADLGRAGSDGEWMSSDSCDGPFSLPLLLTQFQMPVWEVGLCIPLSIPTLSLTQEAEFFRATCPIPQDQVFETSYWSLFGLIGAARESNLDGFNTAIRKIQQSGWKRAERMIYGPQLTALEHDLYDSGASSVGMSSLGPSLFFFSDNVKGVQKSLSARRADCTIIVSETRSYGRVLEQPDVFDAA